MKVVRVGSLRRLSNAPGILSPTVPPNRRGPVRHRPRARGGWHWNDAALPASSRLRRPAKSDVPSPRPFRERKARTPGNGIRDGSASTTWTNPRFLIIAGLRWMPTRGSDYRGVIPFRDDHSPWQSEKTEKNVGCCFLGDTAKPQNRIPTVKCRQQVGRNFGRLKQNLLNHLDLPRDSDPA
jgi:hypothetical protein